MTSTEEQEMHALAVQLEELTRGTGWEASRYGQIGATMRQLTEYCAVCDCKTAKQPHGYGIYINADMMPNVMEGNTIHDIDTRGLEEPYK